MDRQGRNEKRFLLPLFFSIFKALNINYSSSWFIKAVLALYKVISKY